MIENMRKWSIGLPIISGCVLLLIVLLKFNNNEQKVADLTNELTKTREWLRNEREQLQKTQRQLEISTKQFNELEKQIDKLQSAYKNQQDNSNARQNYYASKALSKIQLKTAAQQRRIEKLSKLIFSVVKDPLDSAITENEIYWAIQRGKQRWVQLFGYDPTDKDFLVIDPIKALMQMKDLSIRMHQKNLLKSEKEVLDMLQFNLGDKGGEVVFKLTLVDLENTIKD